jgi:hypothetical protein
VKGDRYHWLGLSTTETSVVPSWSALNFGGYERASGWPEYHALMTTLTDIGHSYGCGRADWEYDINVIGRYGTPDAMNLLPYWTHDCIASMEGLFYESSATTPYHFLTEAETSEHPSDPMTGLTYGGFDLTAGVRHMRLLGDRYYLAFSAAAVRAADHMPDALLPIARSGPWHIYEIAGWSLVDPLSAQPQVVNGTGGSWKHWLHVAAPWFTAAGKEKAGPVLTADGPSTWQRVGPDRPSVAQPEPTVTVTDVHSTDQDVSFHVSRPGVPVLVKVSYFPNWTVSGAQGPYRATPNFMVVVPTSTDVHLHYGWTPVDIAAYAITGLGLLGLLFLRRSEQADEAPQAPVDADLEEILA